MLYADPGSGILIWQMLLALFIGATFYFSKVRSWVVAKLRHARHHEAADSEPVKLGRQYPRYRGDQISDDGRMLRGHLSFAMHLYGSEDGTADMEVYVPPGFTSHSCEPTPTDAVVTFYYPRLGNLTNVTLAVFHVTNFQVVNEHGRIRIGNIGGRGGSIGSYRHSHLEFYHGDTGLPSVADRLQLRIDPASVFTTARAFTN